MIVLSGADLVLPDRVLHGGTLVVDNGRIVEIRPDTQPYHPSFAFHNHTIVPGFIDVHVHGVLGVDTLDAGDAVARIAASLPRFGVTAFCPTTVACTPDALAGVLRQVRACRAHPLPLAARVLPAHLESNFINPDYCGAQPRAYLRTPPSPAVTAGGGEAGAFTGADILAVVEAFASEVAIVTLAPELDGALALIAGLCALGIRVSLGHSGASLESALVAIAAGATHATHLFNRMPPLHHRAPGLAAAVLQHDAVAAELICDTFHVHPTMVRLAVAAKGASRVMAISDATAVAGLPDGGSGTLGGRRIMATPTCAVLDDQTMAGSVSTMDAAFRNLIGPMGFALEDAAQMCATTQAQQLGLSDCGRLVEGACADLTVLDAAGTVVQTYVGGRLVYARGVSAGNGSQPSSV